MLKCLNAKIKRSNSGKKTRKFDQKGDTSKLFLEWDMWDLLFGFPWEASS